MGDHGIYNHRSTLFDSSTRVPLILAGGALPAHLRGHALPGPCSALDLLPTLLTAAGAEAPAGLSGQDLLGDPQPTLQIVQEGVLPMMALRSPTHRLVVQGIPLDTPLLETLLRVAPFEAPTWSLYDLRSDPGEQQDVLEEQRELALKLRANLIDWVRRRPASSHVGTQPLDPTFQALLRSRGYW
jgi:arylsulfatase A-like enzyme